jgi:methionyl aminopeptidase
MIEIKTSAQLEIMTEGGALLGKIRDEVLSKAQPGVTTLELDELAEKLIINAGAKPNFKGYGGFPYTICANVNELILHGFPNRRPLQVGDVFSLDIGLIWQGLHVDTTGTVVVGGIDVATSGVKRFVQTGEAALWAAIEQAKVGNRVGDVSSAMQRIVEDAGYSVIREFVGHGIGSSLHMEPNVPCYGRPHTGPELTEGMTLAIEVMMNMGKPAILTLKDGWQVVSKDKSLTAQFEHTVAIWADGPKILTKG